MNKSTLIAYLYNNQLLPEPQAEVRRLTGGVSSDIFWVRHEATQFVVKKALSKLRVAQDWYADVSRNQIECEYLQFVNAHLPGTVPQVLFSDPQAGLFVMDFLGPGYVNWKSLWLQGDANPRHAEASARFLRTVHRQAAGSREIAQRFDTTPHFFDLRIDPYLLATARVHPGLAPYFEQEATRLKQTHLSLVHGDFSPKNMLFKAHRPVVLDGEAAWYGDPAFDAAFLINHFLLKALHRPDKTDPFLHLIDVFWTHYAHHPDSPRFAGLEHRVTRLVLMLLLARIDGKSPVEYITDDEQKMQVRRFVTTLLPQDLTRLDALTQAWRRG